MFISYTLADILYCQSFEILLALHVLSITCMSVFIAGNRYIAYPTILLPSLSITGFLSLIFIPIPLSIISLTNISYFLGILGLELPGLVVKTFLLIAVFLVLILNRSFLSTLRHFNYEYGILLVISLIALSILCSTNDFLTIYLTIELQSLAFYSLIAIQSRSEYSIEAAIKYFVLGAIASCFLLFGLNLIYAKYGTIQLDQLSSLIMNGTSSIGPTIGLVLLTSAFLFKIGIAPFHIWLCDVYEGSVTSLTLLFASIPKIALVFILTKTLLLSGIGWGESPWSNLLWLTGLISVFWGSFAAIYQKRVKRLLSYSSISHLGLIIVALSSTSCLAAQSGFTYIIIYSLIVIISFGLLMLITRQYFYPKFILNWLNVSRSHLWLGMLFSVLLFITAGIPPFVGFYLKFNILLSLLEQSYVFTVMLVVLANCFSAFYYIRLIKIVFFAKSVDNNQWLLPESFSISFSIIVLISLASCYLINPQLMENLSTLVYLYLV